MILSAYTFRLLERVKKSQLYVYKYNKQAEGGAADCRKYEYISLLDQHY